MEAELHTHTAHSHQHGEMSPRMEALMGLSSLFGHRRLRTWVADAIGVTPGATVVDLGSGAGPLARMAASRGANVIAVEPSDRLRALAARFTPTTLATSIEYRAGTAEALPVADGSATIVVALASSHHWQDVPAGLRECRRASAPGATLFVVERLTKPGATGHAGHGLTESEVEDLAAQVFDAGFAHVHVERADIGRHTFVGVRGRARS
jgi:ubiquinone/menaquinone biosynthesis C-methylase UbiE